jgi:hypothetical protein
MAQHTHTYTHRQNKQIQKFVLIVDVVCVITQNKTMLPYLNTHTLNTHTHMLQSHSHSHSHSYIDHTTHACMRVVVVVVSEIINNNNLYNEQIMIGW